MRFLPVSRSSPRIRYFNSIFFINIFIILLVFAAFFPALISPSGLTVALPKVIASESISQKGLVVTILADNTIFFEDKKISAGSLKSVFLKQKPGFQVLIKADGRAQVASLVEVWDISRQVGCRQISIATDD